MNNSFLLCLFSFLLLMTACKTSSTVETIKYTHTIDLPEQWISFDWHGGMCYAPVGIYNDESKRFTNNLSVHEWKSNNTLQVLFKNSLADTRKAFSNLGLTKLTTREETNQFGKTYIIDFYYVWKGNKRHHTIFLFKQDKQVYYCSISFTSSLYDRYFSKCLELLSTFKISSS